ncbi:MAG: hypothetical protein M1572_00730 [Gammaproteobacteria bacterium]|nr:hypothetical protein [Gammaproteobacteria bacterium]
MTIGSIACSCLGENPNCFRCGGTGFYNSDDLIKEYVPFSESHVQSCKLVSLPGQQQLDLTGQTAPIKQKLRPKADMARQKTKSQRRPGELTAREKVLNNPVRSDLVGIKETIARAVVSNLSGYHTKNQESQSIKTNPHNLTSATQSSKAISLQDSLMVSSSNEHQPHDMLDAYREFASFARERGRFGSMPSFDAMDDESFS